MSNFIYLVDISRKEKCCLGTDEIIQGMEPFKYGRFREELFVDDYVLGGYIGFPIYRFGPTLIGLLHSVLEPFGCESKFIKRLHTRYAGKSFLLLHDPHINILPGPFDRYNAKNAPEGYRSPVKMPSFGIEKDHVFIRYVTDCGDLVYTPFGSYIKPVIGGIPSRLLLPPEIVEFWEPLES